MAVVPCDELLALLPEPMLLVDSSGTVLLANAAAEQACDRPRGTTLGQPLTALVLEPADRVRRYLDMCARVRDLVPGTLTLCRDRGQAEPMRCEGALLRPRNEDSEPVLVLRWRFRREATRQFVALNEQIAALNREVLQRRRSEAALYEQREWLRVTLASIGDAVIATDRDGRITYMNSVAEQLTGYVQLDALGQPLADIFRIFNEDTRALVENPCDKVLRTGLTVGLANHTVLVSRTGVERPIEDSAAPIKADDGAVLGVVLVFHDVTERRQLLRDREQLLEAERVARAEAERTNRLKDEFLATLSHELRTPLNAILGWASMLRTGRLSTTEQQEGLEVIERSARAQTRIIEDLLDMSRIIAGKLKLETQLVDPAQIVRNVLDSVRPAAEAKEIALVSSLPVIGPLRADPYRLQQIVWNLLSNAIKFTPKRGRVEVSLARVRSYVEIRVVDNGIGIRPEFLPHVFERFRQFDASSTRRHGGLGLGLSIVKNLVELHGGQVTVQSVGEGQGTTFSVMLPVPIIESRFDVPTRLPSTSEAAPLQGVCVQIVDDETDGRELVRRILEEGGAAVVTAGSVPEALAVFEQARPHVLVSDIGMPGQDGYDLIQAVRAIETERGSVTPAIALTAFARAEDRTRALRAGYQVHLSKPIDAGRLVAVVATLVGRS